AFFHSQPLQQRGNPFLREDSHQVIFKREIKARRPGISLAAGTSTKLVVDTSRLVPFRAENMQPPGGNDFLVLLVGLLLVTVVSFRPLIGWNSEFIPVVIEDGALPIFLRAFNFSLRHA